MNWYLSHSWTNGNFWLIMLCGVFKGSAQATIRCNKFENSDIKIIATSPSSHELTYQPLTCRSRINTGPTNVWNRGSTRLSRTWAALLARFPFMSRALERRFGGVRATLVPTQAAVPRISTHFRAAFPRISMQLEAAAPRISTQVEAVVRWLYKPRIPTHSHTIINVVLCIPTKLQIAVSNAAIASCKT